MHADHSTGQPSILGTPAEVVAEVLATGSHVDDAGDLLLALLGFDRAVQALAASEDPIAGQVMLSLVSWLLV